MILVLTVLTILGILEGKPLIQADISNLVFLAAGMAYAVGTVLNWKEIAPPYFNQLVLGSKTS